jgi:hypothetical protein
MRVGLGAVVLLVALAGPATAGAQPPQGAGRESGRSTAGGHDAVAATSTAGRALLGPDSSDAFEIVPLPLEPPTDARSTVVTRRSAPSVAATRRAPTSDRPAPRRLRSSPRAPAPPPPSPAGAGAAQVVERGTGRLAVVPGTGARAGDGPLRRYTVEVEGGLGVDPSAFAAAVEGVLAAPRSWTADGRLALQRVDGPPVHLRVVLASPALTDRLCAPLRTLGTYSCANGGAAVLNSRRWLAGAASYGEDLAGYRTYLVNHEVGHLLGHGHVDCPRPGRPAPVMLQQTKGLQGCARNPWPYR